MARLNTDADFAALERAAAARDLDLGQRLAARERKILSAAIAKWRAGQLTGDDARAALAAIAELRGIADDLEREARQAETARHRLMHRPQASVV